MNQHRKNSKSIERLCNLLSIEEFYINTKKEKIFAKEEIILEVAKEILALDISEKPDEEEINKICDSILLTKFKKVLEPIYVTTSENITIQIYLPISLENENFHFEFILDNGTKIKHSGNSNHFKILSKEKIGNSKFQVVQFKLLEPLPIGYHQINFSTKNLKGNALLIKAPPECYSIKNKKFWGVFVPLYSLYSNSSQGIGDFSDLAGLGQHLNSYGANVISTLPLLPCSYEAPVIEISPYSAWSRLFWNEIYIDLNKVPELHEYPINSLKIKNNSRTVEYEKVWKFKKNILQKGFEKYIQDEQNKLTLLKRIENEPLLGAYAKLKAKTENEKKVWQNWQSKLDLETYSDQELFYVYIQFLARKQIQDASIKLGQGKKGLYADIPIGSHPDGFDCWYFRDLFTKNLNVGAPPDSLFIQGQNWGFWSINQEKLRNTGYGYFIEVIRHHFKHASFVRIDHILGFHRTYVIPKNREPKDGVYIKKPWNEMYAILAIESHRSQCSVIGEALGTVPPEVIPRMNDFGIRHLWVLQYEFESFEIDDFYNLKDKIDPQAALTHNTHDMPPFAAFYQGKDIELKVELGFIDKIQELKEKKERKLKLQALEEALIKREVIPYTPKTSYRSIFTGTTKILAESSAPIFILNLEDVWAEDIPQNVPGTTTQHGNWQNKLQYGLEEIIQSKKCHNIFTLIQKSRYEY